MSLTREFWRLTKPEFAPGLDGEGARLKGGRWNSPGLPMVYAASSLSLATLEVMVHLPASMRRPEKFPKFVAVKIGVSASLAIDEITTRDIKPAWSTSDFRAFGDAWLGRRETVGLFVPSLVIPAEKNLVLNPMHPDFKDVYVSKTEEFSFDPRFAD